MFLANDDRFMRQALALAERGLYSTTPNPRVGCVIVRDDEIVGEGWHERAGEAHAEVHALRSAGSLAKGATAYVTLEPCSHFGRTPPCSDALIKAGILRVICAMQDPNPMVAGRGLRKLRDAGLEVLCGLREPEARLLNAGFISRMERGRPLLRIKSAASLDGRTALSNGASQWITSKASRKDAQHWRARSCAILTGIGTVLADNPRLTVRGLETTRQPLRIVIDSQLKTPLDAVVLDQGHALIATSVQNEIKHLPYKQLGVEVLMFPDDKGKVDLKRLMNELGKRGINEVLTEAGAKLNGALIAAGLADELLLYQAPCLLGNAAQGMFAIPEIEQLENRHQLKITEAMLLEPDLRLQGQFIYPCNPDESSELLSV